MNMVVSGYESYEVTSTGTVINTKRNKPVKPQTSIHGYMRVGLFKDGKQTKFAVHRLVAQAYLPNPENKPCVNHIDGDKTNNCVSNLQWVTYSENELHSYKVLKKKPPKSAFVKGQRQPNLEIAVEQLDKDGNVIRVWQSMSDAKRAGFNQPNISAVCQGRNKTHRGYGWRYVSWNLKPE